MPICRARAAAFVMGAFVCAAVKLRMCGYLQLTE